MDADCVFYSLLKPLTSSRRNFTCVTRKSLSRLRSRKKSEVLGGVGLLRTLGVQLNDFFYITFLSYLSQLVLVEMIQFLFKLLLKQFLPIASCQTSFTSC